MATKVILEIQGNLYDFWECRSLELADEYNEVKGCMEYKLVMNKHSIQTNYTTVEFIYDTPEERAAEHKAIKEALEIYEGVLYLHVSGPKEGSLPVTEANTEEDDNYDENEELEG